VQALSDEQLKGNASRPLRTPGWQEQFEGLGSRRTSLQKIELQKAARRTAIVAGVCAGARGRAAIPEDAAFRRAVDRRKNGCWNRRKKIAEMKTGRREKDFWWRLCLRR